MMIVEATGVTHRFGRVTALRDVTLQVPAGAMYALLGPNGAGKTTLLQLLMGLRRASAGQVRVLGSELSRLTLAQRSSIGYVAEGQRLPERLTLRELESFLAPLYDTWDRALADELRRRFRLDAGRRIGTYSRGEQMKAALLCTLAPRPRLLLMDEPFSGMDAAVKDDLVRGLLEFAGSEGWTVLISSHDLAELESLCDWVGFLDNGRLLLSEPMDTLRERFRSVDVLNDGEDAPLGDLPQHWLGVERAGRRIRFVTSAYDGDAGDAAIRGVFPGAARIDIQPATLREVFIALARSGSRERQDVEVGV